MASFDIVKKGGQAPARLAIDHLDATEIEQLRRAGTIISDPKRRRPRYFDGRFLAAPDLTREQDYFIARQADLTRAGGAGVLHGLQVNRLPSDDTRIQIERGNGVTPAGDMVVLTETITIDLADVAEMQRLDKAFALDLVPNEPPRRRTGIFVLALRSIEYTANPIAAYPSSVAERRAIDDGEIIEGVAVTLIPYRDDHTELDPQQQRGYVARRVFVEQANGGVPSEALPIAMVQLDRGFILWVDPWLARREIGAEHAGVTGFGLTPRSVREAHVQQYNRQMDDVVAERQARDLGLVFPATNVFGALPPAGYVPLDAVIGTPPDTNFETGLGYTQIYFPPQIQVSMAMVPPDEIPALVDESLVLPPIDVGGPAEGLDFTSVVILLPVWRYLFETIRDSLAREIQIAFTPSENERPPAARRALVAERLQDLMTMEIRPAAPGILTRRRPVNVFRRLMPAMASTMARARLAAAITPDTMPISLTPVARETMRETLRDTISLRPSISTSLRASVRLGAAGLIAEREGEALQPSPAAGTFRSGFAVRRAAALSDAGPAPGSCPPWFWAAMYFYQVITAVRPLMPVLWYVRTRTLHVQPDSTPIRTVVQIRES